MGPNTACGRCEFVHPLVQEKAIMRSLSQRLRNFFPRRRPPRLHSRPPLGVEVLERRTVLSTASLGLSLTLPPGGAGQPVIQQTLQNNLSVNLGSQNSTDKDYGSQTTFQAQLARPVEIMVITMADLNLKPSLAISRLEATPVFSTVVLSMTTFEPTSFQRTFASRETLFATSTTDTLPPATTTTTLATAAVSLSNSPQIGSTPATPSNTVATTPANTTPSSNQSTATAFALASIQAPVTVATNSPAVVTAAPQFTTTPSTTVFLVNLPVQPATGLNSTVFGLPTPGTVPVSGVSANLAPVLLSIVSTPQEITLKAVPSHVGTSDDQSGDQPSVNPAGDQGRMVPDQPDEDAFDGLPFDMLPPGDASSDADGFTGFRPQAVAVGFGADESGMAADVQDAQLAAATLRHAPALAELAAVLIGWSWWQAPEKEPEKKAGRRARR
jgi:hypothetical protein